MSITVVIYLSDNSGQQFIIPNGKTTTASQYLQLMIATLKLPDALAKKCFALWLKSPLLDVQLKPNHVPFRMVQQWPMLIDRYSMASDTEKSQDEPALIFRRSAFLSKDEESQITNKFILDILLVEARYNIQQGIYPCDPEDVEQLGALMCLDIKEKEKHGIEGVVKENLQTLVPNHLAKVKKTFLTRQQSMEERVLKCVKKVSEEDAVDCVLEFMKICWQLPYYGSVVFPGFVEKAQSSALAFLTAHSQVPVRVAINTSGVWVIDCEKKHVLIGLLYDEFNWEMTTPNDEDPDPIPSLFLEFEDEKTKSNKLLQIASKQATMMNSMIETCITMIREKEQVEKAQNLASSGEESNGIKAKSNIARSSGSTRVRPLFERQNSVTSNRPEKLSLTRMSDSDDGAETSPSSPTDHTTRKLTTIGSKRNLFKRLGSKHKIVTTAEELVLL